MKLKKYTTLILISLFLVFLGARYVMAAIPEYFLYQGELLDSEKNPRFGNYTFRFSFWKNINFETDDKKTDGALDTSRPDYLNWQEVQSLSLLDDGRFSIKIGEVNTMPFPFYDLNEIYLQVEIKNQGDPDSAYELIDSNPVDNEKDRMIVASVPYAYNAQTLNFREPGFEENQVPYLDAEGQLPTSAIPGGTEDNIFVLDSDGDAGATDSTILKFGESFDKTIAWHNLIQRFIINDDLEVQGDIYLSGTINGVDINELASSTGVTRVFVPAYDGGIFHGDGSDNSGSMFEEEDPGAGNILRWETRQPTLQDYDIIIRYRLPDSFDTFPAQNQVELNYKTQGAPTDSFIHFTIRKEGDPAPDELSGSGAVLSATDWTQEAFSLADTGKWNAGDTMIFRLKMSAKQNFKAFLGALKLKFNSN